MKQHSSLIIYFIYKLGQVFRASAHHINEIKQLVDQEGDGNNKFDLNVQFIIHNHGQPKRKIPRLFKFRMTKDMPFSVQDHLSQEQFHVLQPTLLLELKLGQYELNPVINNYEFSAIVDTKRIETGGIAFVLYSNIKHANNNYDLVIIFMIPSQRGRQNDMSKDYNIHINFL